MLDSEHPIRTKNRKLRNEAQLIENMKIGRNRRRDSPNREPGEQTKAISLYPGLLTLAFDEPRINARFSVVDLLGAKELPVLDRAFLRGSRAIP